MVFPESSSSPSERLRIKVELASGPFGNAFTALLDHARISDLWIPYLITQHAIIKATVPLFETTRDRARALKHDPVAAGVASYMDQHIVEELHHDEWLLDDLEVLGADRRSVLHRAPPPSVAALVGSQYYWVLHVHPVAILGYLAFMEGFPPTPELIDLLIERTGYPREAFRTFAEHGELDTGHRDEIDGTIDSLPLDPWHETLLGVAAMSGLSLLAETIEDILESG